MGGGRILSYQMLKEPGVMVNIARQQLLQQFTEAMNQEWVKLSFPQSCLIGSIYPIT